MTMSITEQAEILAIARKTRRVLREFPGRPPASVDEAYRLQSEVQTAMDEPVCGWKIGATNRAVQEAIGTAEPFAGPLYVPRCHGSGAELPVPEGVLGVECEFAFRLAHPLPSRPLPYTSEEVIKAVGSVHPAIELVGLCLPPAAFRDVRWCIADHALDVAFVAGAAIADWHSLDLPALSVRCVINGTEVAVGNGTAVLGNPVTALTWLANALSSRGCGLLAGDWISTGTCTGIQAVRLGDVVEAVFGGTDSVRVAFR